jgi:hypothetical protein
MKPGVFLPFMQLPGRHMAIVLFTAGDSESVVAGSAAPTHSSCGLCGCGDSASRRRNPGVISFGVSRRTRAIGIRMALGAHPSQVMRTVLAGGMTLVGIGAATGLIASQFTARLLQSLLFGVSAHDMGAYAAVVVGTLLVGFLVIYIPAWRASRVDPTTSLRFE